MGDDQALVFFESVGMTIGANVDFCRNDGLAAFADFVLPGALDNFLSPPCPVEKRIFDVLSCHGHYKYQTFPQITRAKSKFEQIFTPIDARIISKEQLMIKLLTRV